MFQHTCIIAGVCMYVGNINSQVTKPLVQEVFYSTRSPLEGYKLIRKDKSSYVYMTSCSDAGVMWDQKDCTEAMLA
ncbi:hypothetical protein KY285_010954 [Solanum tuberosum]|nr:hypothetical protein KY289_011525 [Solanum tuberosum]KAH0735247.1 hypothetical protein KY285_010954 [Solanum tuberosum]